MLEFVSASGNDIYVVKEADHSTILSQFLNLDMTFEYSCLDLGWVTFWLGLTSVSDATQTS